MEIKSQVNKILRYAVSIKCSDIYFLPRGDTYQIKLRTQFGFQKYFSDEFQSISRMINYLKFMGDMVLSESRRPQIGAMEWKDDKKRYFLRLSTVGDFCDNESLVLRIIYDQHQNDLQFINFAEIEKISDMIQKRGMIIFAGPTGSGKTSTIYSVAKKLAEQNLVMSIEDPVEIKEEKFLQLQVNNAANMGFSELIKVGLRHRPDVFIIGEIRDKQTAKATIQAALSGHLVLTTVHAQDPLGICKRLL